MLNKFREAEAIIPYREQNHREHFHQGEPIRAVLKRVEETPKGPRLILSRGDPLFVKALFKLEVPEIQQNIVEIRAAAREVGSRTKIAVFSRDDCDRSGRRVRRPQGLARAGRRERAGRRAHRHRAVVVRPRALRQARARAGQGGARVQRSGDARRSRRWWTKTSSRWPSAATARTCASRRSSRAGRSTSTRAANGWRSGGAESSSSRRCRRRESEAAADVPLAEIGGHAAGHRRRARRGGLSHAERHHRSRARGLPQVSPASRRKRRIGSWR